MSIYNAQLIMFSIKMVKLDGESPYYLWFCFCGFQHWDVTLALAEFEDL